MSEVYEGDNDFTSEVFSTYLDITCGLVYLLESGGFFKIGRTVNIDKRVRSLQTGNPHTINVIALAEVSDSISLERELHTTFRESRQVGEWFSLTNEQVFWCRDKMINAAIRESAEQNAAYRQWIADFGTGSCTEYDPSEEVDLML